MFGYIADCYRDVMLTYCDTNVIFAGFYSDVLVSECYISVMVTKCYIYAVVTDCYIDVKNHGIFVLWYIVIAVIVYNHHTAVWWLHNDTAM